MEISSTVQTGVPILKKSEHAFRTISEVAELLELPSHVLRFWESKFRCIKPLKRGGGRRYYRPDDINLLFGIKHLLYSEGLTIRGSLKLIQNRGVKSITLLGVNAREQTDKLTRKIPSIMPECEISETKAKEPIESNETRLIDSKYRDKVQNFINRVTSIHERMSNRIGNYGA